MSADGDAAAASSESEFDRRNEIISLARYGKITPEEAKKFIDNVNATMLKLGLDSAQASWVQATYITDDTEAISARANQVFIDTMANFAKDAVKFDKVEVPGDIRRQLNLLKLSLTMVTPADPKEGEELRRRNKSYVFFRETNLSSEQEPLGAQGISLMPGRSIVPLAVVHFMLPDRRGNSPSKCSSTSRNSVILPLPSVSQPAPPAAPRPVPWLYAAFHSKPVREPATEKSPPHQIGCAYFGRWIVRYW